MLKGARILVAPLDWGLGHAARCVPIISRLLHHGAVPVLGADAGPLALLTKEFPELEHVRIPGLAIRYGRGKGQLWSMAKQFPSMMLSIRAEHSVLERLRRPLQLDAVISDQRFGLRSKSIPSVVITHQAFPFTPFAQGVLRKMNLRNLSRFDRCWIMDEPMAPGLAGDLSHGSTLPANARYIGIQSRLVAEACGDQPGKKYRIVAVISGPEPQRTILEGLLTDQLQRIDGEHLLVSGLPGRALNEQLGNVTKVSHMRSKELCSVMRHAELIVSRSGYTTLMDLSALSKHALVIPTPGQTEQEYLGRLHRETGRFTVQHQGEIDIDAALTSSMSKACPQLPMNGTLLEEALADLATLV